MSLEVRDVTKSYGGVFAVQNVSFRVDQREIVGVIGPNGAGKSTLVDVISGGTRPDTGDILLDGADITKISRHSICRKGLARTFQIPRPFTTLTVEDNVRAAYNRSGPIPWAAASDVLDFCDLAPRRHDMPDRLTHADLRRLEIARALATGPEVLLLDEPGAGLSEVEVATLIPKFAAMQSLGITVVLIDHVMHLVMGVSKRVIAMQAGSVVADGTPDAVANDPRVLAAYLGSE